ncbi:hypothetical protein NEMIN01_2041 [Nematocida minor]|uniref:uncharacterized protein n=1 Tax=Nematocida minor TaxID=1912983 RepID=UPI00221E4AF8|nr:uncharacterized protein NEMIN01_2041 [Nematocida minor]KAI5192477.1 hypothetical protein NEMIN01_2041 [Nematocida minor]
MVCSVGIFYYKRVYSAGELVSGYITLQVTGVISIENIVLSIDKESEIRVDELNSKTVSNEKTTRHLGRFVIYGDRTRKMLPGMHKFPFSFRMMPGEGATIEYKKITQQKHIYALNKYISKCEVKIYGIFKPVAKFHREICMVETAPEEIERKKYKHQISNCLCFSSSTVDILIAHDSVLYAGKDYPIDIAVSTGADISGITASLEMKIQSFTESINPIKILFPCKVTRSSGKVSIKIDDTLPSETSKNDFFSISYNIIIGLVIKGEGRTQVVKKVSVRSKGLNGEYSPPEIPESAIYPEKYLSLHC